MQVFTYVAKNSTGHVIKGYHEADSSNDVYVMLKKKGYYPVQLTLHKGKKKAGAVEFSFGERVKLKDMAVFARQFSTILRAGVPMVKCLDILRKQTESKKLAEVLDKVFENIQKGVLLSDAMRQHKDVFSSLFINMIEAGEISGTLDNSLEKMATNLEKEFKLNQKIKSALTYPSFMMSLCLVAVGVLLTFVVPQFGEIFEGFGVQLPVTTQFLLDMGNFMKNYWYMVLIALIGLVVGLLYFKRTPKGKEYFDRLILEIPVVSGLVRKVLAARFTRLSSTMLGSGVSLIKTLEVAEKVVDNIIAQRGLRNVQQKVTKGGGLAGPVAEMKLFPIMVSQMISIGEESGALDKMLEKTADFCEDEVDAAVSQAITLLEPAILIFMAVVVGFVVLSVVVPIIKMPGMIGS